MKQVELLSIRQAAEILGIREGTCRLWLAQRRLPKVKLGRMVRVPADAVERLIADATIPARER
jgi:excisionase family DNA binding protein